MTPLITILLVHIGADIYSTTYPSQMACGEALVAIAESTPVVEMLASADVDAVLGQAVDLSCEIIGDLME